jgi:hypothetical protein
LRNSTENVIRTQFGHSVKPGGNIKLEFDLKRSCTVTLDDRKNPVLVRWGGDELISVKSEQVSKEKNTKDEDMSISQDDELELQETESDENTPKSPPESSKWTETKKLH